MVLTETMTADEFIGACNGELFTEVINTDDNRVIAARTISNDESNISVMVSVGLYGVTALPERAVEDITTHVSERFNTPKLGVSVETTGGEPLWVDVSVTLLNVHGKLAMSDVLCGTVSIFQSCVMDEVKKAVRGKRK